MDKLLHTSLFRAILKSLNRKVVSEKRLQTYFLKFARLITALCDDTDCLSALHTLNYTQIQFRFLLSRIHEPSVSLPPYIHRVVGEGWSLFGLEVPGIPVVVEGFLAAVGCADWLSSLILDGIVAGVGAVLGFVPQMLVLFIFLAFLESCGYMARVAFIMDRIFRKFGLSGKSFIPMLIGTGCGVPGIMASRTIENDRDRKMTIMTTTFIPCGAKLPIIALFAGALFGGASWVAPSAYFVGIAAIICSGIILKKTKMFAGDPAPFVMELPAYHLPTVSNVLRSMWERGWNRNSAVHHFCLVYIRLWLCGRTLWNGGGFVGRNSGVNRPGHCLDIRSSWMGELAGCCGGHHRSGCKGKCSRYLRYSLRLCGSG